MPSAEQGGGDTSSGDDREGFRPTGEEVVHRGWLITVVRASFVDPDGEPFERDVVRHPGAVAVVAVTGEGSVVLVRQYRPAVDRWTLEIPAGTCDVEGEPAERTALRELTEEAGYEAEELALLTRCAITPGFCDEMASIYLATGLAAVPSRPHGVEEHHLTVHQVSFDDFDRMVDRGEIIDAQTILGVGLARRHLTEGALPG